MTAIPDDARAVLDGPNIAHVATVLPDGGPHVVPTWVATRGDRIVFLTGPGSRKARNLERDPRVALSVADADSPTLMVHVRGHVVERLEGDPAWSIIDTMAQDYLGMPYPRGEERVVFLVEPDHLVTHDFAKDSV